MRIFWMVFFILFLGEILSFAQEEKSSFENIRKNTIYFEILGNGAVYSLNFDRIILLKDSLGIYLRIGGNEYHGVSTDELSYNFIISSGFLIGGPVNFFEPGIGYTYFSGSSDRLFILQTGYRFCGRKGFSFRVTPMYINNSEKGDTFGNCLWIGFSFGFSF